jgi:hypothetical protein
MIPHAFSLGGFPIQKVEKIMYEQKKTTVQRMTPILQPQEHVINPQLEAILTPSPTLIPLKQ